MIFAANVLVFVPKAQLSRLSPPPGLNPYTGAQLIGRDVYIANGCIYCHSQQVRDAAITTDPERWGRPSVPADYVFDFPHLLGTMRTGPDLMNVGARLPDRAWHLAHLYNPRSLVKWSIMPSFPFLFEIRDRAFADEETVNLPPPYAAPPGKLIVATKEASRLVDYLLGMDHTYPIRPEDLVPTQDGM
ncbi:MAG: cbb3-type cytochrome c oxidase subunit II [Candidatus Sericytochromatia bacterium]|nr:cbb3-type cytochrome c oxidase subunit II [Candidatus Sericytochromatia bacterium]